MRWILCSLFLIGACSQMDQSENGRIRKYNEKKEAIYRLHDEIAFVEEPSFKKKRGKYPWEEFCIGNLTKITKEYFRCKGSDVNPMKENQSDCSGNHPLPMQGDKEFVSPVLIQLLNYIQKQGQRSVIITTGHRCPVHNRYADSAKFAQHSKHQTGAEVDFYVEQFEDKPLEVVQWIMDFYQTNPDSEYNRFHVAKKNPEKLKHPGWYNKEIHIRVHEKTEGRDFDNRHPYPYITIEARN